MLSPPQFLSSLLWAGSLSSHPPMAFRWWYLQTCTQIAADPEKALSLDPGLTLPSVSPALGFSWTWAQAFVYDSQACPGVWSMVG